MTSVSLTYYQRVMLWNLIGAAKAPSLKEASVYLRVMEKIRLTDQESAESQFLSDNNGVSWRLPSPGYGNKTVELEESEVKALTTAIEAAPEIRVADAEWMIKVLEQAKEKVEA